jgi:OHCU decarboxylase
MAASGRGSAEVLSKMGLVEGQHTVAKFRTDLEQLNLLSAKEAESEFLKCCGSPRWARQMASARHFESFNELSETAERVWWSLEPHDWLEAFRSHPKIGEQKAEATTSDEAKRWSEAEQSGVRQAAAQTMQALADLNHKYEEKFGYIFIVCASGKSSDEMLAILRSRLGNNPDEELRVAAAEQAKITKLRLMKLVGSQSVVSGS